MELITKKNQFLEIITNKLINIDRHIEITTKAIKTSNLSNKPKCVHAHGKSNEDDLQCNAYMANREVNNVCECYHKIKEDAQANNDPSSKHILHKVLLVNSVID
jgi:hypothetical protein